MTKRSAVYSIFLIVLVLLLAACSSSTPQQVVNTVTGVHPAPQTWQFKIMVNHDRTNNTGSWMTYVTVMSQKYDVGTEGELIWEDGSKIRIVIGEEILGFPGKSMTNATLIVGKEKINLGDESVQLIQMDASSFFMGDPLLEDFFIIVQ